MMCLVAQADAAELAFHGLGLHALLLELLLPRLDPHDPRPRVFQRRQPPSAARSLEMRLFFGFSTGVPFVRSPGACVSPGQRMVD